MTRVVQIVSAPVAGKDKLSTTGPERRASNLCARWSEVDVDPILAYPRRGNMWDNFVATGVELHDYEIRGKADFSAIGQIANLIRKCGATAVHTQGPAALDMLASLAARWAKVPLIVTRPVMIADQVHYTARRRAAYQAVDRMITLPRCWRVIAVSRAGLEHMHHHCGVEREKLQLIHNGVKLQRFADAGKERRPNSGIVRIGMIGQLFHPKAWPDFVAVIAELKQRGNRVEGLIVGDGPLRGELENVVRQQNLDDVITFAGYTEDVRTVLPLMDVFLFTSHREGLSVAVIEAMASGLPIVATQVGGIAEQIDEGVNGYIVEAGDIAAMAKQCQLLVQDASLRTEMGQAGQRIAFERFDEDRMLNEYAALYHRASNNIAVS